MAEIDLLVELSDGTRKRFDASMGWGWSTNGDTLDIGRGIPRTMIPRENIFSVSVVGHGQVEEDLPGPPMIHHRFQPWAQSEGLGEHPVCGYVGATGVRCGLAEAAGVHREDRQQLSVATGPLDEDASFGPRARKLRVPEGDDVPVQHKRQWLGTPDALAVSREPVEMRKPGTADKVLIDPKTPARPGVGMTVQEAKMLAEPEPDGVESEPPFWRPASAEEARVQSSWLAAMAWVRTKAITARFAPNTNAAVQPWLARLDHELREQGAPQFRQPVPRPIKDAPQA